MTALKEGCCCERGNEGDGGRREETFAPGMLEVHCNGIHLHVLHFSQHDGYFSSSSAPDSVANHSRAQVIKS